MTGRSEAQDSWTICDLVDFEYAQELDRDDSSDVSDARDAQVRATLPCDPEKATPRLVLRQWLDRVKAERFEKPPTPGELVDSTLATADFLAIVVVSLSGFGLASQLLSYRGVEPVNVSAFLGIFVLLQAILAALTALVFLVRWNSISKLRFSLAYQTLYPLFSGLVNWLLGFAANRIDSRQRDEARVFLGRLRGRWSLFGDAIRWRAFSSFQKFAIAFNLGALVALLAAVAFTDRAFGWQTTLDLDAERLHRGVVAMATPWSWYLGEGVGYPSAAAVEGSRIVLKDGIRELDSQYLASWWPFLALSLVAYGFLPRLIFLIISFYKEKKALASYRFGYADAQRIYRRITAGGRGPSFLASTSSSHTLTDTAAHDSKSPQTTVPDALLCLVSYSLADNRTDERFSAPLARTFGVNPSAVTYKTLTAKHFAQPEQELRAATTGDETICFVFESWMPPIQETKGLVEAARRLTAAEAIIRIALAGKPKPDGGLQPVAEDKSQVWQAFVTKTGDPYLLVESLIP